MKKFIIITLSFLVISTSCKQQLESRLAGNISNENDGIPTGEYLGQTLPGLEPILFAPGIVSNGLNNRDITISPDGNEIYFTSSTSDYSYATVFCVKREDNEWSIPKVTSFGSSTNYIVIEPCLSYDGNQLFYASDKLIGDSSIAKNMNIWMVEREDDNWGEPILLDSTINTSQGEYYPSLTKTGTLYFTREEPNRINNIYRSKYINGSYALPEKLPEQVNCGRNRFNAYISPDESFIIIPAIGVEKDVAGTNYYISFRNTDNGWSEPINMGDKINKDLGRGWSASISPDGKYLFFMSSKGLSNQSKPNHLSYEFFEELQTHPQNGNPDIYWISSGFIKELGIKEGGLGF